MPTCDAEQLSPCDDSSDEDKASLLLDEIPSRLSWSRLNKSCFLRLPKTLILSALAILCIFVWALLQLGGLITEQDMRSSVASPVHGADVSITSCGTTSIQAHTAGCSFDMFSFGWYPPECTDSELYGESVDNLFARMAGRAAFIAHPDHEAAKYLPKNLTAIQPQPQPKDDVDATGIQNVDIIANFDHHLVACTYAWQKVQRAAVRRWPLDEWSSSLTLARQCGPDLLAKWRDQELQSSNKMRRLRVWYPKCGLSKEDLQRNLYAVLDGA
ncbi:hypothetical protein AC579_9549 [Pseudocercospora musae]|uniref:Uncharacterized protein n=1 Tax=Pseudocercospora musae TaxID=113226 RepID=A0A139I4A6_9PEZI|nr:hypothetical protein AC579_9549 [Pseudocercospora musae]